MELNRTSDAVGDINIIRLRAGLPAIPTNISLASLRLVIARERQIELFAEWGHRWLDLLRTGEALRVLIVVSPTIRQRDLLYPIPEDELLHNPNLVQNPGY